MNWKIKLLTQNHQIKDIIVYDFNNPTDAEYSALAQTGGLKIISCTPTKRLVANTQESKSLINDVCDEKYYFNAKTEAQYIRSLPKTEQNIVWLFYYAIATCLPSLILYFISPYLFIIFNILFSLWWFKK
jgi:hypothetical protein